MAQKLPSQYSFNSIKKPSNKKSTKKLTHKPLSLSNCAHLSNNSSSQLPDQLPFLSLNLNSNQISPDTDSPFVMKALTVCFEEGFGSREISVADFDEVNLMDDYHPLGDVSHKRVRLALWELGNSVRYPLQPQNKKIGADISSHGVSSSEVSPSVSEIGISMSTCDSEETERDLVDDGIISDGCLGEVQGIVRKKQTYLQ